MKAAARPPMLEREELETALHALAVDVTHLRMKVEMVRRRGVMPQQWQSDTNDILFQVVATVTLLHEQVKHYWPSCPDE